MKKILYIAMLLCLPVVAMAQVSKQVEVTKDYKPNVDAAQKLSIIPDMTDTVTMRPILITRLRPARMRRR